MKPFGRKLLKRESLATLIELRQIPGEGWKILDERTWRTGSREGSSEAARVAGAAGSITALRSFNQEGESRWVWVESAPFESNSDASSVLVELPSRFLPNPRAEVTLVSEKYFDNFEIVGLINPWVYEQLTTGASGPSASKFVAATVDNVVFIVACTGLGDGWDWSEVATIASLQSQKIRDFLRTH